MYASSVFIFRTGNHLKIPVERRAAKARTGRFFTELRRRRFASLQDTAKHEMPDQKHSLPEWKLASAWLGIGPAFQAFQHIVAVESLKQGLFPF